MKAPIKELPQKYMRATKQATITLRLTPIMKAKLKANATRYGLGVSEYVRFLIERHG